MEVYLDLVVILNFLVDFLLILGTNRLSGHNAHTKRAALGAVLGAVYATACMMPGFSFLGHTLWRLVFLILMSLIAFGWSNGALRRGILFTFLSMALGGIALGLGNGSFWGILAGAFGVTVACAVGFCGRPGQQRYVPVKIEYGNQRLHLTALLDTGNTLRDPVSGIPVLVVDGSIGRKLLGFTLEELAHPVETLANNRNRGLRLIPYHAVGQPAGMLLGLTVDSLSIGGKNEQMILGFAPQKIGQGKPYQALAGGNIR